MNNRKVFLRIDVNLQQGGQRDDYGMVGFEPYLKLFDKVRAVTKSARYAFFI